MQFHLAYFTPVPLGPGIRGIQRRRIDLLVAMAKKALATEGFKIPNDKELRHVIRLFVRDGFRGRIGYDKFTFMIHQRNSPTAQSELIEYLGSRLGLQGR